MSIINMGGLRRLLRLMTEAEKSSFRAEFQLPQDASDAETVKAIEKLPTYEAVRAFVRVAEPTLVLLREVFEMLTQFGIAAKTTGCVFVLANPSKPDEPTELVFSQQTVGMISSWVSTKGTRAGSSLPAIQATWNSFRRVWDRLLESAHPRRRLNATRMAISRATHILADPWDTHVDQAAQKVLAHFVQRISKMEERLRQIPDERRPEELTGIMRYARQFRRNAAPSISQRRYPQSPALVESVIHAYTRPKFATDFDKFLEDLYTTADLLQGKEIVDMLQIDVWATRPQLFEVWVLLSVLTWLRNRGYQVQLLKTVDDGGASPPRWNLSYAKDSKPCAIVRNIETGVEQFLFYQLYRPSGDMPDIALLEGADPSSAPIWSVDPKHSPKDGYSLSSYRQTAKRYRDRFGAKLSLVVEYFDRSTLGDVNPTEFGPGAKLIRGCRPDGSGMSILLSELAQIHPAMGRVLVCIDFSGSFSTQRDTAIATLRKQYISGLLAGVAPRCIVFAGNALVRSFHELLNWGDSKVVSPEGLQGGTASEPLFDQIAKLKNEMAFSEVLLVGDGEFGHPLENLTTRIEDELGLAVMLLKMDGQE